MNIYQPQKRTIMKVTELNYDTKVFRIKVSRGFTHQPGQFVELSVPGIGEAPISICSSPEEKGYIDLCIRRVGSVTNAVHKMTAGDAIYIRGPYGVGFPLDSIKGKDIVYLLGGLGLPPVRGHINYVLAHKEDFGRVTILYGARTPADLLFKHEFDDWKKRANFLVTVDAAKNPDGTPCHWDGCVGFGVALIDKLTYPIKDAVGIIVGPPVMYKFAIKRFKEAGMEDRQIYVSLERLMKCGVGKCQHCQINHKYCCLDGPVFNYAEVKELPEAI
ncbi:MAG: FAD/NAD(P)-binding protein [Thermoplasmata archaeon]